MDPAFVANDTFNPYSQSFVLTAPDGITPVPAAMDQMRGLQTIAVQNATIYGSQVGVTVLLLVILLLMTQADKRKSLVFLMNTLTLMLVAVRNILACCELAGLFYNYYNWQLHYYPPGPALSQAQGVSLAAEIFSFFIDMTIYGSLVLQVQIVCVNLSSHQKSGILAISALVASAAVLLRLVLAVINGKYLILGINSTTLAQAEEVNRVASAFNIVSATSIAFFSAIFVAKLAFAIRTRHKLGMQQFGPMQIIFVMGCQTMFIPLIFAIIAYYAAVGAQLESFVPTIVAVFLPLSGMWASANTRARTIAAPDPRQHRAVPVGASDLRSAKSYGTSSSDGGKESYTTSQGTGGETLIHVGRGRLELRKTHIEQMEDGEGVMDASDLEMQRLKEEGVVVDRSYTVRSD